MQTTDNSHISIDGRKYYLDWLRIFATLLLFIFHTARCFDTNGINYIENPELSGWITIFFIYDFDIFHMPLFFFIAGASSKLALDRKTPKEYFKDRFKRLLIPFFFGLLFIVPPQSFVAAKYHNNYGGSFLEFILFEYFQPGFTDLNGYRGTFTFGHLWFILVLFIISTISIPFMVKFNSQEGKKWQENDVPTFFNTFIIPVLTIGISLLGPEIFGKKIVYYVVIFINGFFFAMGNKNKNEEYIVRKRKIWLGISIIGFLVMTFFFWFKVYIDTNSVIFDILKPTDLIFRFIGYSITMYAIILASVGYSYKYLNKSNKFSRYFTSASYPLYILHQTVIFVLAFFIVQLSISYWGKFILIIIFSFGISIVIYEIIRKIRILDWAFGIKREVPSEEKKKLF
ncbi:MAG: acyltransferase family protein [archaeon]|nr:acyltransferase family protein [archaeon]